MSVRTVITNAHIVSTDATWVLFDADTILDLGTGTPPAADTTVNTGGAYVLPGVIDAHVHFREPGLTHKADIASESRAARAGGVTTVFDMPNTIPQTVTRADLAAKTEIAHRTSEVNIGFFIGATNTNIDEILATDFSTIPGVKVFMGSSTGNMLVDDTTTLDHLFESVSAPIVVHAEDETIIAERRAAARIRYGNNPPISAHSAIRPAEACVSATRLAVELAERHPGSHLHIAHLSTADEVRIVAEAKARGLNVTAEVSPTHLLFTVDDYELLGSRIKINPAVKTVADREALRRGVIDGTIDIIATDHAPHLLSEKAGNAFSAVSGAPMVQFSLPLMLDMFGADIVCRAMSRMPARIFDLENYGILRPGARPDIVIVEKCAPYTLSDADVVSKCGWTPLTGTTVSHRVVRTFVTPRPLHFRHR